MIIDTDVLEEILDNVIKQAWYKKPQLPLQHKPLREEHHLPSEDTDTHIKGCIPPKNFELLEVSKIQADDTAHVMRATELPTAPNVAKTMPYHGYATELKTAKDTVSEARSQPKQPQYRDVRPRERGPPIPPIKFTGIIESDSDSDTNITFLPNTSVPKFLQYVPTFKRQDSDSS